MAASRHTIVPAFRPRYVMTILTSGGRLVPVILSAWVVRNLDVYIVAGLGSNAEAGLYRVASRVAAIASLGVGFFMMAWLPLRRTSLFRALEGDTRHGWLNATMATYFFVTCMGLLVLLGVAARLLIRVAGPAYSNPHPPTRSGGDCLWLLHAAHTRFNLAAARRVVHSLFRSSPQ